MAYEQHTCQLARVVKRRRNKYEMAAARTKAAADKVAKTQARLAAKAAREADRAQRSADYHARVAASKAARAERGQKAVAKYDRKIARMRIKARDRRAKIKTEREARTDLAMRIMRERVWRDGVSCGVKRHIDGGWCCQRCGASWVDAVDPPPCIYK